MLDRKLLILATLFMFQAPELSAAPQQAVRKSNAGFIAKIVAFAAIVGGGIYAFMANNNKKAESVLTEKESDEAKKTLNIIAEGKLTIDMIFEQLILKDNKSYYNIYDGTMKYLQKHKIITETKLLNKLFNKKSAKDMESDKKKVRGLMKDVLRVYLKQSTVKKEDMPTLRDINNRIGTGADVVNDIYNLLKENQHMTRIIAINNELGDKLK